jgi:hypothetical protein
MIFCSHKHVDKMFCTMEPRIYDITLVHPVYWKRNETFLAYVKFLCT